MIVLVRADGRYGERIRVLIGDEHPVFRTGLRKLLEADPAFEVVGEAGTGNDVVSMSGQLRPDAVLMEIALPGIDGIMATRAIAARDPGGQPGGQPGGRGTAVVILTVLEDHETFFAAMRAGARGYLLKGASMDDIGRAIDTVRRGGIAFGPGVASWVIEHLTEPRGGGMPFPELTDRERAVLELIADGRGNAAIARDLDLSIKTVRNYLSRIFAKLRIVDRTEAVVHARRAGMGQQNQDLFTRMGNRFPPS
ncbi:response regulator [Amycolatopsis nigrescens]|uniref:response regulator n=1 Tax=Amycolatopsis nigrescens TaxID=381445 RepID=UPI00037D29C9|nr:response regulator transcription factor [Amycolatopsis nigrescens]